MKTPILYAVRRRGAVVGLAGTLGLSAILGCAVANASAGHSGFAPVKVGDQKAPAMKLKVSQGEKINDTGDQGIVRTSAVQGIVQSPLQCDSTSKIIRVNCDTQSLEATPQVKGTY